MSLVGQWRAIERGLGSQSGGRWGDARLRLTVDDEARCSRAAALLGPAQPYRMEVRVLRFTTARDGTAPGPDAIVRLLRKLDRERIGGTLELVSSDAAPVPVEVARTTLVEAWDAAAGKLPADWSDLLVEVELLSSDYLDRAALLLSPANPRRDGGKPAFRFRCARSFGYGVAPEMLRRCFERCDAERIRGSIHILRVLSDSRPVHTQGPVWHIAGRTV